MERQRLNRTRYQREGSKMRHRAARVTPDNKAALVDYLANRYPYRPRK